ncbi:MAG: EamA family transporter [Chloroflexota bacterium]
MHNTTTLNQKVQIPWAGLITAFLWAISPIFIRLGLDELPSPLWGVAIGLTVNVFAYGILLWVRRSQWRGKPFGGNALWWQLAAAVFVGLATWARWIALDTVPVAVVTALSRLSVPLVIVLSLFMLDQKHERVNWKVWMGGGLIVAGALVLTFFR